MSLDRCLPLASLIVACWLPAGCRGPALAPELREIYSHAASRDDGTRNPVIVIPGFLGSKLVNARSGEIVWGVFEGACADTETPEGARAAALPMRRGAALADLTDETVPDGVFDRARVSVVDLPQELQAYVPILDALGVGGYRDEERGLSGAIDHGEDLFTCFQFDYDWRRDGVENARRLYEFILEKKAYVEHELERHHGIEREVKFDIVAHSMGGLLARYFLRYGERDLPPGGEVPEVTWAGGRYVERVVLVATPNAGTARAVEELLTGLDLPAFLPDCAPAILGTMPSVYQMLPRSRHGVLVDDQTAVAARDLLDPAYWERRNWGLASHRQDEVLKWLLPRVDDKAERRRIALDHQRKCLARAKRFQAALDVPAKPPRGLELYLIAGDGVMTDSILAVNAKHGGVTVAEQAAGDGVVLRSSALMDERAGGERRRELDSPIDWRGVLFFFTDAAGLTRDAGFTDNLLYLLLEAPR